MFLPRNNSSTDMSRSRLSTLLVDTQYLTTQERLYVISCFFGLSISLGGELSGFFINILLRIHGQNNGKFLITESSRDRRGTISHRYRDY